jgi:hypothetical protein
VHAHNQRASRSSNPVAIPLSVRSGLRMSLAISLLGNSSPPPFPQSLPVTSILDTRSWDRWMMPSAARGYAIPAPEILKRTGVSAFLTGILAETYGISAYRPFGIPYLNKGVPESSKVLLEQGRPYPSSSISYCSKHGLTRVVAFPIAASTVLFRGRSSLE